MSNGGEAGAIDAVLGWKNKQTCAWKVKIKLKWCEGQSNFDSKGVDIYVASIYGNFSQL